jgi:hypothetical protein
VTSVNVHKDVATRVYLRHLHERLWYGQGKWCKSREDAVPFPSNSDALLVCNGARVAGVLVGVNAHGHEIYFVKTDAVVTSTPRISAKAA